MKDNKGMAMIMAVAALVLILYIAMEVTYDASVEYQVNSQNINQIKAYYAAKSAVDLSLLRIKIYQSVKKQFGNQLGSNSAMLEQIWQFPFAWPLPISEELNAVDKDSFKKITKESLNDTSFVVTISDEGTKIDITNLISPSKVLRENTRTQLINIFDNKLQSDENFAKKYELRDFEAILDTITDWMSDKNSSVSGGDKKTKFAKLNQNAYQTLYPPNRPFRTLDELRFIPNMSDELFDLLEPHITIFGIKAINPNTASKEVLKSLDNSITDEIVKEILARRDNPQEGGPFKSAEDFWNFVSGLGARLTSGYQNTPLIFEGTYNFRIKATGSFSNSTKELDVITYDLGKVADQIKTLVDKEKPDQNPSQPKPDEQKSGPNQQNKQDPLPKGPPRIVYWSER